jgi:hypothetical protein
MAVRKRSNRAYPAGFHPGALKAVGNTLRHDLAFGSWEALERLGPLDGEKATRVTGWIRGAALEACRMDK